jgi:hypothetical protein
VVWRHFLCIVYLGLITLVVPEYDPAMSFFVNAMQVAGRVAVFRDIAGNRWDLLGPG